VKSAAQWLDEYGESHRHPLNKALHWVCVPVIVWCVAGFLWSIPTPRAMLSASPFANWATLVMFAVVVYYAALDVPLALGAAILFLVMLCSLAALAHASSVPLWAVCAALFLIAWIGQFVGHAIEGKRPSFFKDLQFLLIGPFWLLADLYRRLGYAPAAPMRARRS
jgi:uncharacterized membrane protein YGL010W